MPPDPGVGWMDPDQETVVPEYRKTKTAGVYVRHQARCPAGAATAPDAAASRPTAVAAGIRSNTRWCGR